MGLFSILSSSQQRTGSTDGTESTLASPAASSLDLPTVVQLYRSTPIRVDLSVPLPPSYAILSYSAVSVSTLGSTEFADAVVATPTIGLRVSKKTVQAVPELGIWNCRVVNLSANQQRRITTAPTEPSSLQDVVMKTLPLATSSSVAFVLTVDLSQPNQVEPTLTLLQQALVRYLIETKPSVIEDNAAATATTSLYDLRTVQFGLAPEERPSATVTSPDESDGQVKIALMICAVMPEGNNKSYQFVSAGNKTSNTNSTVEYDSYRDKQSQMLLLYHLRRFAAALNAHLCFVGTHTATHRPAIQVNAIASEDITTAPSIDTDGEGLDGTLEENPVTEQPSLSVSQLGLMWREFALGRSLLSPESLQQLDFLNQSNASAFSLLYGPDNHNAELIESVLLRNAHYPGQWDAAKDSLWSILPVEPSLQPRADVNASDGTFAIDTKQLGDDDWLMELRDSVLGGATATLDPLKTPNNKSAVSSLAATPKSDNTDGPSSAVSASGAKTPSDMNVSSFFENLLKT